MATTTKKAARPSFTNRHNDTYSVGDSVRVDGSSWDGFSAIIQAIVGTRIYVAFVRDGKLSNHGQQYVKGKDLITHDTPTVGRKSVVDAFAAVSVPINK